MHITAFIDFFMDPTKQSFSEAKSSKVITINLENLLFVSSVTQNTILSTQTKKLSRKILGKSYEAKEKQHDSNLINDKN